MWHITSSVLQVTSSVLYVTFSVLHTTFSVLYTTFSVLHVTFSVLHVTFGQVETAEVRKLKYRNQSMEVRRKAACGVFSALIIDS